MVIQRTKQTVEELKTRPRHERLAVAGWVALGVIGVLFVAWAAIFMYSIRGIAAAPQSPAPQAASAATPDPDLFSVPQSQPTAATSTQPSTDDIQATQGDTSPDMQVDMTSTTTTQ